MNQVTIGRETELRGVGLHTGVPVRVVFRPAPANTGLRFFRADLGGAAIPARAQFVVETRRGTTLALGEAKVHTVEHVLSAAQGLGIDDLDILLDAPEPPAMDGSALPFSEALLAAGLKTLDDAPRRQLRLAEELTLQEGGASYSARPADRFEVSVTFDHPHRLLGRQSIELAVEPGTYLAELAGARTFCLESEVAALKSAGLAQGGSLENCVVVTDEKVLASGGGLRFRDEFVRHKALDLIGDLALIGRALDGVRVEASRTGHAMNVRFARLLNESAKKQRRNT